MRFLNTSDLMPPDWRFLADVAPNPSHTWEVFSGVPRPGLERALPRPHLGRWRAAASAARAARLGRDPLLVSHLPAMTAATEQMRKLLAPGTRHVAFAFNFTDLPQGRRLGYFRQSLKGVMEFVVFSRFERSVYSDLFALPQDRFRFLPWAMKAPTPGPENPVDAATRAQGYLCAIGGEGRDYALLAEVMRQRPAQRVVVVARPYSVAGIAFPDNVTVFTNLALPLTWRLAQESRGLVIPLKTDDTACGHITMVGAQLLGIPLVVTRSRGVEDYVDDTVAQMVPARDATALGAAVDRLHDDPAEAGALAQQGRARAQRTNALANWVDYFEDLASRIHGAA